MSTAIAVAIVVLIVGHGAGAAPTPTALQLNGTSQYVTFGAAPGLGATQFTLETWFKRTGAGVGTSTGALTNAIPLVTKGRGEADTPANVNLNYFLGIDAATGRLVADFEDTAGGANHPVTGTTVATSNVWHHAAVTFNGTTLTLYLDGVLDGTAAAVATPESTSIQHAALGTAMNSTGVAAGFFQGILDEARIWNVARSALEINGSRSQEITSAPGLLGRWSLNEGAGSTIGDSTGNLNIGTAAASPTWATDVPALTAAPAWNAGLYLGGVSGYVTFGAAPSLGAAQFTLETWFKRTGAGVGQQTGTGGLASAVPLVTKGRNEAEASNLDMNYFLGIDTATSKLAVDFEEGATGASPGLNHPLIANTVITNNVWHHAAATYDGQTWKIYLDGALDGTLAVGQPPRSDSIQHAALGTAMTSTGAAGGFFQGALDEARIWNYARTQAQIQATKDFEVSSGSGVIGRWGLNEGGGTSAATSFGVAAGTIVNAGWVAGAPVTPGGDATPPAQPQGLTATPGNGSVSLSWNPNTDADLRGYNIYRSTSSPVSTAGPPLNGGTPPGAASYTDNAVTNGTTYFYAVVAVDNSWNTSAPSSEASATPQASAGPHALSFNGSSQYVTMGSAAALGAAQFTLETWFRRTGAGVGTSTGTGGIASALPLMTKGRAESETPANLNMNYFLGIDATSGKLVADFEDTAGGANHPVSGATVISQNVWHHAAATFDGSFWRLYLDGVLDAKLAVSATPEATSIQHAALASALNSSGVAAGFFQGDLDEARIWSQARTGAQIRAARNTQITSAAGLAGRFGMNEGSGSTVGNSAGSPNGTAVGSPPWIEGYGFPQDTSAPAAPQNVAASPDDGSANLTWTANTESDLAGYNLYRSTSSPVSTTGSPVNGGDLIQGAGYTDTGLTNGSTYYYALVAVDGSDNRSGASNEAGVTPAVGDPVIVGAGDIAVCGTSNDEATADTLETMPNAGVYTIGDNVYENGLLSEFNSCYTPSWGRPGIKARTRPAPGNHDYGNGSNSGDGYFDYFNGVGNFTGPAGDRDKGYYSYDVGDYWHVVVLNSECGIDATCTMAAQTTWLRGDLAANASKSVIGMFHRPRWTSGPTRPGDARMQPLWQALYDYGAELALSGHDHDYERFAPQDDTGQADPEFGVRQIVVGTGGASLSGFGTVAANSQVRDNNTDGVLKLTLHQSSYNWQFIPSAGGTFTDSGSQATHGAPPNAAPTATVTLSPAPPKTIDTLTATATKNDADGQQVSLTYVWKVNGTTKRTFTSATALSDTFNLATGGNGDRGDVVRVEVTPNDGITDGGTASDQLTVANSAPVFSQDLQDRTNPEGDPINIAAPATDADTETLTYGATNLPPGLSINTGTGTISGTIDAGAASGSPYPVSVTATDGTATATDTFSWTITHTNRPPVVDSATIDQAAPKTNDTLTVTVTAHDDDNDQLTYAYQWTRNGVDISGATAATLNLGTSGDKGDAIAVRVTANDGRTDSAPTTSASVTVVNSDPQFNQNLGDRSSQEGANVSVSAAATDADGDSLTYEETGLPPGLSINASTGLISGTIAQTAAEGSPYSVAITVRDGATVDATDTFTWTVTPLPPAAPQGLGATAGDGSVSLSWTANSEPDLAGYNVYRSTSSPVQTTTPLNGSLLPSPSYVDTTAVNYTTYFYVVKAVDTSAAASAASNEASATPHGAQSALQFNGSNQYVTMGSAASLGAAQFTLETWFRRTGAGVGTSTGTGGVTAVPLITKGRAEAETPANLNMNYFLGIDSTTGVLVGDFEDTANGTNHPVSGSTAISLNVWHHAAATFDGSFWRLYLDGVLETKLAVSATPESSSIQHAALASALNSSGVAAGFFQGQLDEARIWSLARTGAQIRSARDSELASAAGLVGRFGFNEGTGATAGNSAGSPDGTLLNGPSWISGYGFFADGAAPAAPSGFTASAGDGAVTLTWTANGEADLAGYDLYRSTSTPVDTSGTPLNGSDLLRTTSYTDSGLNNGTTYHYALVAVDGANNRSAASPASATPRPASHALSFNGSSQYVTMGSAASLGAPQFTLETWFRRTGAGVGTSTGSGGIASAVPLVTKGRAEAETPANLNMNYFLGIDSSSGTLVADFEDTAGGLNHPVSGTTVVSQNVWHHAAATFDGSYWRLYLDGVLETKLAVSATPESSSIQHAALGSALTSNGTAAGFFQGNLDEARIWSYARTGAELRSARNGEIASATGLVGRFGMNEGSGSTVGNSAGAPNGTTVGSPAWIAGYDFPQDTSAPAAPQGLAAAGDDSSVSLTWTVSGEADVAGYNLYRSSSSPVSTGGSPLNGPDLIRGTSYTDIGLANGTTYYYALVAVDSSDNRSPASNEASATPQPASHALSFNGSSQYVTMGSAASLGAPQFTLETWFRRTGAGVGTSTGSGGVTAVPLITKGRAEAETPANLNMNYFLGIDSTTGVLVADFEDTAGGLNHPASGSTVISQNVWHHAAATFDGSYWRLYLDGVLEEKLAVSATPESSSIQHAALASALNSTGVAAGFFQGDLDEARIWSSARTGAQLRSARNAEIASGAGLVGRFGMNEGLGSTVGNSAGSPNGTAVGSPAWIAGYGFPQDASAPAAPQNLAASPDDGAASLTWNANGEADLAGYNLYRSTSSPVSTSGTPVNGGDLIQGAGYTDTGLTNGTTYFYALVAVDSSDNRSGGSNQTSATPALGDPVIVGAGDIAVCGTSGDEATADTLETMPNAGVFTLGDNVYENGLLSEFNSCYGPSWGRAGIKARTRPTPGNHDYGNGSNSGEGYFDYFNGAGNFTGAAGDRDKGYYSYDVGNYWHVVVLNSECGIDAACTMAAQETWLRGDLAANPSKNVIGMFHRPRWTSGPTRPGDTRQQPLWEALYDYGAELVLAGHDHDYERFAPQNASGQLDTAFGVREIVVGTGGASFSGFGTVAANSEVRNNNTDGVLKLTLHQSSYNWQFIRSAGGTFTDSGSQATHGAPSLAPVVDSVTVTPTSPLTNDTLTASVTAHDPNGDPITLAYQWTRNGVNIAGATAATLNLATAGNGNKGDAIAVRVTASDGTLTSAPNTSSAVTVQNSAPTATVALSTHNPATNAVLTATATKADPDADTITLTFVWKVNGTVRKTTANSAALTDTFDLSQPGNGDAGNVVRVEVTPSDGTAGGATAFDEATVDAIPPATPGGLSASVSSTAITLDWADNTESDLAGYNVYRAISGQPTFTKLNGALLTTSTYRDTTAAGGGTYDYRVTAVDTSANESQPATTTVFRGIAFRAASSTQVTNSASLTLARPTGTTAGDGLLAVIDVRSATTITSPAGWTLVRSDSSGSTLKQSVYVKIAGGSEPASYPWTFSGSQFAAGAVLAYAGVHATSPIAASGGSANASSTSITAPSITTSVANTLLVGLSGTATNASITPPSGMTELTEVSAGGKQKVASETADAVRQAVGATGSRTATASSAAVNIGQLVALRPAGAPAGGDIEPPSRPTNLAATAASSTQIDLTWSASTDNVGVDHYAIYRGGTQVGTSTATQFSDVGLTPSTQYTYTVEAFDAASNPSGQSDPATTTTLPAAGGGIAFRAASSATTRGATSLSIPRPTGTQSGNVLIASLDVGGAAQITAPAGWTLVRTDTAPGSLVKATFWHLAAANDPASFTWTFSSSQLAVGSMLAYSGVDPTNPVDATSGQANASSTAIVAPSVTANAAGSLLVMLAGVAGNATVAPPTGMTERVEALAGRSVKVAGEASDAAVGAGSTGARTATASRAAANIGQLVVLRKAP